jgi:hypothetical protein
VLAKLKQPIEASGGVAILSGESVSRKTETHTTSRSVQDWAAVARQTIVEFLGPERRAASGTYQHRIERHEDVLARSAFCKVEKHSFAFPLTLSIEDIIGLRLSTSYASPAQLGDRLDEFRSALRDKLRQLNPSGCLKEKVLPNCWSEPCKADVQQLTGIAGRLVQWSGRMD